jgi:hypothetical protein
MSHFLAGYVDAMARRLECQPPEVPWLRVADSSITTSRLKLIAK